MPGVELDTLIQFVLDGSLYGCRFCVCLAALAKDGFEVRSWFDKLATNGGFFSQVSFKRVARLGGLPRCARNDSAFSNR